MNDDAAIIAAAREGFLDEAHEMLRQFEQALLVMETAQGDAETLNAAFRAAHTIKGGAGLFGFDAVVAFTHEVETLLDALRAGKLAADVTIVAALLESRDQIGALLAEVDSGASDPAVSARSAALGGQLRALLGGGAASTTPAAASASSAPAADPAGDTPAAAAVRHLSLRFGADALRHGLDPLAFIRYLGKLGTVTAIETLTDAVPALESLDPEACHLGFELRFASDVARVEVERVFEFAQDDSDIVILEPTATPADYQALLERRSGDDDTEHQALLDCWKRLGLTLPLRPALTQANAPAAAAAQQIERRAPAAPDATKGGDRRQGEGERRSGTRDRRSGDDMRFVRVRADKLDRLIDLIGELVIAGSGAQMVAHLEQSPAFIEATQRVTELVQEARDGALALRMVPIGETFARFQRVVRDIGKALDKDVVLEVSGGETELDKSMVEVIADPLMHLVRNSLDHGLETAAEREAAGKPATGTLKLHAYHEAGSIVIEVSDDGRGLNRDRIVAKAVERGLVDDSAVLSDNEVWQLIFQPGFSTAEQVTDLSGRGVGMDVVRRNIESLRGKIALASNAGAGTTVQIRLPLTLAMIDGFLTLIGGVHCVLPLAVVSECIDVPRECLNDAERVAGTFDLRGEVLPYLDVARFYGMAPAEGRRRSLIVVRDGSLRIGLVVDRLLGEHQTVIKPLAGIFQPIKALAGSTILGSGEVALVLDVHGLHAAAVERPHGARAAAATA